MTILFLEDWDKYPNAIPDLKTKNESWLYMASLLKKMGIKNHYFHLALLNPELQNIDPFKPNLPPDIVLKIGIEIKYNPWYFFREIARLPNGNNPLQFRLSRPVLALYWSIFNGIPFFLIMPRQIGKTAAMELIHCYLRGFKYRKQKTYLQTKDTGLLQATIEDMKAIEDLYPLQISPIIKYGPNKDANNKETITCNRWGNETLIDIGHAVKLAAENVFRGERVPFFHSDETAWTVNSHLSIPHILFAMGAARENFEKYGEVTSSVYTSTPGYLDTPNGKFAYELLMSGWYWNEKIYDFYNKEEAKEFIKVNSPKGKLMVNGTFNHRQAGKDDEWLKERVANSNSDIEIMENNLFNKWSKGSLTMLLTKVQVDIVSKSETDSTYNQVSENLYMISWYITQRELEISRSNRFYGLGLDPSQAVGRDANGIVIVDFQDMSVVATSKISEANLYNYGYWVANILIANPQITLVIENKASGQYMLDAIASKLIIAEIDPFKRIYNRIVDTNDLEDADYLYIKQYGKRQDTYDKFKKYFGISTNENSRKFLYDTVIQNALNATGHLVKDAALSSELRGLVVKNGRVDHTSGGHDDLVIGWLMAHWFIKHSRNIQYYGIDRLYCLSMVSDQGATLSPTEMQTKVLANALKQEINKLTEAIKNNSSVVENMRDEKILAIKVAELKSTGDVSISLDSIMRDISEAKVGKGNIKQNILNLQKQRQFNNRNYLQMNDRYGR